MYQNGQGVQGVPQNYAEAAKRTAEPELRRLLNQLAKVELEHKQALQQQLEQLHSQQAIAEDLIYSFGGKNPA